MKPKGEVVAFPRPDWRLSKIYTMLDKFEQEVRENPMKFINMAKKEIRKAKLAMEEIERALSPMPTFIREGDPIIAYDISADIYKRNQDALEALRSYKDEVS